MKQLTSLQIGAIEYAYNSMMERETGPFNPQKRILKRVQELGLIQFCPALKQWYATPQGFEVLESLGKIDSGASAGHVADLIEFNSFHTETTIIENDSVRDNVIHVDFVNKRRVA